MVDFSIEPEFQEKLDWMDEFVAEKIYPLEYLYDYDKDAPYDFRNIGLRKIIRRLQEDVKAKGMWGAHLPKHLGGQGFGAVKLTYINERFGFSGLWASRIWLPGARQRKQRDSRHVRERRAEETLPHALTSRRMSSLATR